MGHKQISDECRGVYKEIELSMKLTGWSPNQLAEKISEQLSEVEVRGYKDEVRVCERIRKMLRRRSWDKNKARKETLNLLIEIQGAIKGHEDYTDALIKYEIDEGGNANDADVLARFMASVGKLVEEIEKNRN